MYHKTKLLKKIGSLVIWFSKTINKHFILLKIVNIIKIVWPLMHQVFYDVSGTEEGVCCGGWLLIIINFCNTAKIIPEIPKMTSPVNVIDNQAGIPNDSKIK